MKQSLQLKTSQHLALTPQLQQSIRLLQLSTLELHQELSNILIENPMLERVDDPLDKAIRLLADGSINTANNTNNSNENANSEFSQSEPLSSISADEPVSTEKNEHGNDHDIPQTKDDDWSFEEGSPSKPAPNDLEDGRPQLEAAHITLKDHLLAQMRMNVRTHRDCALVEIIIDAVDENGYLIESLEQIHDSLPIDICVDHDELRFALNMVQSFDPDGIGARDLSECLALQIKKMPNVPFVTRRLALSIVQSHLTMFGQREFSKLRKLLNCDDEDLRDVETIIHQCDPKPGAIFSTKTSDYVVPDVVVKKIGDEWHVMLNRDVIPRLRINHLYANMMKQQTGDTCLSAQVQEAKWLIKNMRQRFDTILRVSQTIVERQYHFFTHGAIAMKPLVLREIADTLGLHESTISRVTTQKYMLTPHGMFELKYFFGSHVATETGGEASSTAIRALITQLIGEEDRNEPLSDSKIAEILGDQGMVIARRTVAKYRDGLKIPPVSQRKSL